MDKKDVKDRVEKCVKGSIELKVNVNGSIEGFKVYGKAGDFQKRR